MPRLRRTAQLAALVSLAAALLAGCAALDPAPRADPARRETVLAVTADAELIRFVAGDPARIVVRVPLRGLPAGERLVGIDFRVARGVLYALSSGGRLYTLDPATGRLTPVGSGAPVALPAGVIGFDFNPAADRIRLVGADGDNLRLHPDTGAVAAADPPVAYAPGDPIAGQAPRLAGAAYTYNQRDDKLTTNYAIDRARGTLVTQGTLEGTQPAVSPNTGLLFTVGVLGTGPIDDAAFDIADIDNTALAALRRDGRTRLHLIDLKTGRARDLGPIGDGRALWGLAIQP